MTVAVGEAAPARLPAYALFAGVLSAAGLPLYIHAPKFYADSYGVGLGALGAVLFALRLVDVVQDPILGWLVGRTGRRLRGAVLCAGIVLAAAMVALFAVPPPLAPILWFGVTLTGLFTAFSFLTIAFYAQGVAKAEAMGGAHVRVGAWRETGALIGISVAAVAPTVLGALDGAPFALFALFFAGGTVAALAAMAPEWSGASGPGPGEGTGLHPVLGDGRARRLLAVAFLNAAPVAVTSTLFLFFVESRLALPGWEGPLLLLFFVAAAASAPLWGRLAGRFGAKRVLMAGMALSIAAFVFAATLGPGDLLPFAAICLASGAALGADMTLLPAIFAARLSRIAPQAGTGFGLWSFVSKATLAVAAGALLPLLEITGFRPGAANPPGALALLTGLYALLPCALKAAALLLLALTPVEDAAASGPARGGSRT